MARLLLADSSRRLTRERQVAIAASDAAFAEELAEREAQARQRQQNQRES
ncbi:MAG: hypothetical protein IPG96_12195 [Proteobacteria bacterium]|nr:hypothetical protein [Pseudomonadota bacterium]